MPLQSRLLLTESRARGLKALVCPGLPGEGSAQQLQAEDWEPL